MKCGIAREKGVFPVRGPGGHFPWKRPFHQPPVECIRLLNQRFMKQGVKYIDLFSKYFFFRGLEKSIFFSNGLYLCRVVEWNDETCAVENTSLSAFKRCRDHRKRRSPPKVTARRKMRLKSTQIGKIDLFYTLVSRPLSCLFTEAAHP